MTHDDMLLIGRLVDCLIGGGLVASVTDGFWPGLRLVVGIGFLILGWG